MKSTKKKSTASDAKVDRSLHFSSRVSRGIDLLPSIDGRSGPAHVFRDTYHAMVNHCGGEGHVPETQRLMCRRAAALEAECVNLEARFAQAHIAGEQPTPNDIHLFQRLCNTQRRVLEVLGWQRTAKPVESLATYLEGKYSRAEDAEVEA